MSVLQKCWACNSDDNIRIFVCQIELRDMSISNFNLAFSNQILNEILIVKTIILILLWLDFGLPRNCTAHHSTPLIKPLSKKVASDASRLCQKQPTDYGPEHTFIYTE